METDEPTPLACPTCGSTQLLVWSVHIVQDGLNVHVNRHKSKAVEESPADGPSIAYAVHTLIACRPHGHNHCIEVFGTEAGQVMLRIAPCPEEFNFSKPVTPDLADKVELARIE